MELVDDRHLTTGILHNGFPISLFMHLWWLGEFLLNLFILSSLLLHLGFILRLHPAPFLVSRICCVADTLLLDHKLK